MTTQSFNSVNGLSIESANVGIEIKLMSHFWKDGSVKCRWFINDTNCVGKSMELTGIICDISQEARYYLIFPRKNNMSSRSLFWLGGHCCVYCERKSLESDAGYHSKLCLGLVLLHFLVLVPMV